MPFWNSDWLGSGFGLLALVMFATTLVPSMASVSAISRLEAATVRQLLKHRVWLWAIVLFLTVAHGLLATTRHDIDFLAMKTYWLYLGGAVAFNLFLFLAFHEAEIQVQERRGRYLLYAALLLLACHVGAAVVNPGLLMAIGLGIVGMLQFVRMAGQRHHSVVDVPAVTADGINHVY